MKGEVKVLQDELQASTIALTATKKARDSEKLKSEESARKLTVLSNKLSLKTDAIKKLQAKVRHLEKVEVQVRESAEIALAAAGKDMNRMRAEVRAMEKHLRQANA